VLFVLVHIVQTILSNIAEKDFEGIASHLQPKNFDNCNFTSGKKSPKDLLMSSSSGHASGFPIAMAGTTGGVMGKKHTKRSRANPSNKVWHKPDDIDAINEKFGFTTNEKKLKIPAEMRKKKRETVTNEDHLSAILEKIAWMENATKNRQGQAISQGQAKILLHCVVTEMEELMNMEQEMKQVNVTCNVIDTAISETARRTGYSVPMVKKIFEEYCIAMP
jgi:hypothetical protein